MSLPCPRELPLADAVCPSTAPTGQRPGPNAPSGARDGDFALLGAACRSHTSPWLSSSASTAPLQVLPCCPAPATLASRCEGQPAATDHPCPVLRWRNAPGIVSITSPSLPAPQRRGCPRHTQGRLPKEVVRALVLWRQGHSPHRSQQCRSLSVPRLPRAPSMGLLLSQASPVPGTSLCCSGREAQEGQRCLAVTPSHGHIRGPPASHFPYPAAFGAEPHSAPDPSVGQLEALSELPGLVFPLGKRSGIQRARAPLGD